MVKKNMTLADLLTELEPLHFKAPKGGLTYDQAFDKLKTNVKRDVALLRSGKAPKRGHGRTLYKHNELGYSVALKMDLVTVPMNERGQSWFGPYQDAKKAADVLETLGGMLDELKPNLVSAWEARKAALDKRRQKTLEKNRELQAGAAKAA